jgi:hypothetical protein
MGSAGGRARQARLPTRGTRQHAPSTGSAQTGPGANNAPQRSTFIGRMLQQIGAYDLPERHRRRSAAVPHRPRTARVT